METAGRASKQAKDTNRTKSKKPKAKRKNQGFVFFRRGPFLFRLFVLRVLTALAAAAALQSNRSIHHHSVFGVCCLSKYEAKKSFPNPQPNPNEIHPTKPTTTATTITGGPLSVQ
jgi:hypothetical protein